MLSSMKRIFKPIETRYIHKNPAITVKNQDVADSRKNIVTDKPLMRQVVSDLENGVTSRPSVPACFEDETELGTVDRDCDIRNSRWDELSAVYNPDTIRSNAETAKAKADAEKARIEAEKAKTQTE